MLQRRWHDLLRDLTEQREFREAVRGAASYDALQAALTARGHALDRTALAEFLQELHRHLPPRENDELDESQLAGVAGGLPVNAPFSIGDVVHHIGDLVGHTFGPSSFV